MSKLAYQTYKSPDCNGCARVDIKKDSNVTMNVLEINVTPSMREGGLVFTAVTSEQNSFDNFIITLLAETI